MSIIKKDFLLSDGSVCYLYTKKDPSNLIATLNSQAKIRIGGVQRDFDGPVEQIAVAHFKILNEKDLEAVYNSQQAIKSLKGVKRIVPFFDDYLDTDGKNYYIFMPYFPAGSLQDKLSCLTLKQKISIGKQLLRAVGELERKRICHGDLKLENLLVRETSDGKIKLFLTDFRCCSLEAKNIEGLDRDPSSFLFLSPEEIFVRGVLVSSWVEGQNAIRLTPKIDMWSLGIIFHTLFIPENPIPWADSFNGAKSDFFEDVNNCDLILTKMDECFKNYPEGSQLECLIKKMLNPDASKRPSARSILLMFLQIPEEEFAQQLTQTPSVQ